MREATMTSPAVATAPGSGDAPTPENYTFLTDFIRRESGISLGEDKAYLLKSRLAVVLNQERLKSLDELCARMRKGVSEPLRRKIVESMTTHETLFFRDPTVYEMLRSDLIPELVRRNQSTRTLRIWSAACSSGQEPYSLGMLLLEAGLHDWNIEILGTDLSNQILERARTGRYLQLEVNRGLPAAMLVKYFERRGIDWQISESVRKLVRFQAVDLRSSLRALGPFDLVLCRNVLIYFDLEVRRKILAEIRSRMLPGAHLLLGASETTFNLDESFLRRNLRNTTVYQLVGQEGRR